MPFPSPSRLESFLTAYGGAHGMPIRVWGVDVGAPAPRPVTFEVEMYGHPPRLVLLGGGEDGLAVVRQTRDGFEDLDGALVPWESVARLERDPHLVRDVVRVEVSGRPPLYVAVSNHVLLPGNRSAAKALCDLARNPRSTVRPPEVRDLPTGLEAHPA
jgi:hypothetical protein